MIISKITKSLGKDQIANGWELTYVDFFATDQLVELCKQNHYSPHQFENGVRNSKSYLKSECIIVDFDDGLTIEEAKNRFKGIYYFLITSKSHQTVKPKKEHLGKVDRFHVIFPLETPITNPNEYVGWKKHPLFRESDPLPWNAASAIWASPMEAIHYHNVDGHFLDSKHSVPETVSPKQPTPTLINFEKGKREDFDKVRNHCEVVAKASEDLAIGKLTHEQNLLIGNIIRNTYDDEDFVKELYNQSPGYDEKMTLNSYRSIDRPAIPCSKLQDEWRLCNATCKLMKDISKKSPIAFKYRSGMGLEPNEKLLPILKTNKEAFIEVVKRAKANEYDTWEHVQLIKDIAHHSGHKETDIKKAIRNMKEIDFENDFVVNGQLDEVRAAKQVIIRHSIIRYQEEFYQYNEGVWDKKTEEEIEALIHKEIGTYSNNHSIAEIRNAIRREALINKESVDETFNKYEIACNNGIYDVRNKTFREFKKEDYRFQKMKGDYDRNASCPDFDQFIDELFVGDSDANEKKQMLQEIAGYLLIPDYSIIKKMFYFWGPKANNGKSSFLDIIREVMGSNYIDQVPLDQLKGFLLERLSKAHANLVGDQDANATIPDGVIKQLVGGRDTMTADRKYKEAITFKNHARLIFGVNKLPVSLSKDSGYYTRVVILKFNNSFVLNPDPNNSREMKADAGKIDTIIDNEKSGILNWMLEGLERLLTNKDLTMPNSSIEALKGYEHNSNPINLFVDEKCELSKSERSEKSVLYKKYKEWSLENGHKPFSAQKFYMHMELEHGIIASRTADSRYLNGIKYNNLFM
jgi:putative DNA primase/helicase